jgi:predicted thioesterase
VEGRLLTDVGGTLLAPVLSTPGMISMMERNCSILARDNLPEDKGTVGFEVCIKHVGGAPEGATCTVHAKLTEVIEDRKLRFDVEVKQGDRTLGVGTHERRVIDLAAHAEKLETRN